MSDEDSSVASMWFCGGPFTGGYLDKVVVPSDGISLVGVSFRGPSDMEVQVVDVVAGYILVDLRDRREGFLGPGT